MLWVWERGAFLALLGGGGELNPGQPALSAALPGPKQDFFGLQQRRSRAAQHRASRGHLHQLLCSTQGKWLRKAKRCLIPNPFLCPQLHSELLCGRGSRCSKLVSLPQRHKMCSRTCGCLEEYCVPAGSPVHVDGEAAAARCRFLAAFKLAGFAEPLTMVFPRGAAHGRAQGWLLPCRRSFGAGMLVAGTAAALPAAGHRAAAPQAPNPLFFFRAEHEEWEKQAGLVPQRQLAVH